MNSKFTFLLFSLFALFRLDAQIADGSIAPDWTLTSLLSDCSTSSNTYNLYDQLDAGKHVVIDFSATWCGPCWSYHNSGALETLYETHGPTGDNTARVFYIEADCATNDACLCGSSGCNSTTQGNWMLNTPYPVFNPTGSTCTSVTNAYDIGYYPTIFAINANTHTIWETGQMSAAGLESWLYQSFTLAATYSVQDNTCVGNSGAISVSATGGYGNLSYHWNTGSNQASISGLNPGLYSVTITDGNGYFIKINDIEVGQAPNPLVGEINSTTDASCYGSEDGSIDLNISGGSGPYTYQWSNGATTQDISNVSAGNYFVTVSDILGCEQVIESTVSQPDEILINANSFEAYCGQSNGSISTNTVGGNPPYSFTLNGITNTEGTFNNLAPGVYVLSVVDYSGCEVFGNVEVTTSPLPVSNAGPDKVLDCGVSSVTLNGTGSSIGSQFSFLWTTTNGHIVSGANTKTPVVDAVGTYQLKVTDVIYGCVSLDNADVTNGANAITATISQPNILTCTNPTTEITATSSPSGSNITYLWTTTDGHIISGETTPTVTVDQAGNYNVLITNTTNGCYTNKSTLVSANLAAPSATSNNGVLTCQQNSVQICATINSQYSAFSWADGTTDLCKTVNSAGQYAYTVVGENGCTFSGFSTVTNDNTLPVSVIASHGDLECGNTSLTLYGTGSSTGTDYTYLWTTTDGTIVGNNNEISVQISGSGTYNLAVTNNSSQCTSNVSTTVSLGAQVPEADFTYSVNYNSILLDGQQNKNTSSVWTLNGQTVSGEDGLFVVSENGDYEICHNMENSCGTDQSCITVSVSSILPFTFTQITSSITCSGMTDGSITINPVGGIPPYNISWTGPNGFISNSFNLSGLSGGTYFYTLTDSNNNTSTGEILISEPQALTIEFVVVNATSGLSNGSVDVTITGGNGVKSFSWSNGATTEDLTNVPAGEYTLTVTDENGCTKTQVFNVGTTGVQNLEFTKSINVYPNPTNNIINIDMIKSSEGKVTIFDLKGIQYVVRNLADKSNITTVDISKLESGVYMIRVETDNLVAFKKLIKI